MLHPPTTHSKPRPPARRAQSHRPQSSQPHDLSNLSLSPELQLSDSPLNAAARLLQHRLPGQVDFKSCGSFAEGWTEDDDQLPTLAQESTDPDLSSPEPITAEWVNAKTREELESLLLAADRVIRERERDLGIAASIGKSLLENNIALRARQESLLARASINTPSPPASLLARRLDNPRSNVSEYIEARPPPSPLKSVINFPDPIPERDPHSSPPQTFRFPASLSPNDSLRRHSVSSSVSSVSEPVVSHLRHPPRGSSATLVRLSEQNEALAGELAALEAQTSASEQRGRRRLRKLVKELDSLRTELRATEERNRNLEEERSRATALAQQRSPLIHRDDHLRHAPEDADTDLGDDHDTLQDVHESRDSLCDDLNNNDELNGAVPRDLVDSVPDGFLSEMQTPIKTHQRLLSQASSVMSLADATTETSPGERALVSQLLAKISELQDSQHEFDQERDEMEGKLNKARDEVDALRRMVDDAEEELQHIREITEAQGLIGWEDHEEELNPKRRVVKKAAGNRKMIENRNKFKRRHWPAAEPNRYCSISTDHTPVSTQSVDFEEYYHESPPSPSLRGRPLSLPFSNGAVSEDEQDHQRRILRAIGGMASATPSIISSEDGDGSVRLKSGAVRAFTRHASPLGAFEDEVGERSFGSDQTPEGVEGSQDASPDGTPSPTARPPTRSPHQQHGRQVSVQVTRPDGKTFPESSISPEQSYDELQRAVADLPVAWADEDDEESNSHLVITDHGPQRPRKRESGVWVYEAEADDDQGADAEDPWTTTHYASSARPRPSGMPTAPSHAELLRRHRLLMARSPMRPARAEDAGSSGHSTESNSTTVGKQSSDASATADLSSSRSPGPRSRRERALRRLGMEDQLSESGDSSGSGSGTEDESEGEEESTWGYIDTTDYDARVQGASGTDYYPIAMRARHAPAMVATRLQVTGTGWRAFVYQWAKLVGVLGLAVGWAVWQGPKHVLGEGAQNETIERLQRRSRRRRRRHLIERDVDPSEISLGSMNGIGSGSGNSKGRRRSSGASLKKKASKASNMGADREGERVRTDG